MVSNINTTCEFVKCLRFELFALGQASRNPFKLAACQRIDSQIMRLKRRVGKATFRCAPPETSEAWRRLKNILQQICHSNSSPKFPWPSVPSTGRHVWWDWNLMYHFLFLLILLIPAFILGFFLRNHLMMLYGVKGAQNVTVRAIQVQSKRSDMSKVLEYRPIVGWVPDITEPAAWSCVPSGLNSLILSQVALHNGKWVYPGWVTRAQATAALLDLGGVGQVVRVMYVMRMQIPTPTLSHVPFSALVNDTSYQYYGHLPRCWSLDAFSHQIAQTQHTVSVLVVLLVMVLLVDLALFCVLRFGRRLMMALKRRGILLKD